jgi:hypothetical protein
MGIACVVTVVLLACDSGERARPAASSEPAKSVSIPKPATSGVVDPRVEKLEASARALLSAVRAGSEGGADTSWALPPPAKLEAWFKTAFGERNGNILFNRWQEERGKDPRADLLRAFKDASSKGATDVQVLVVDSDDAPGVTTAQKAAIHLAREALHLYTVRFVKADKTKVVDLLSFVPHDGSFAYVGVMSMALQLEQRAP